MARIARGCRRCCAADAAGAARHSAPVSHRGPVFAKMPAMTEPSAATVQAPVLVAEGLYRFQTVERAEVPILRDVALRVMPGEFAVIMGPSGSGKSTLLHLLAGLDQPSAGRVLVQGQDLQQGGEQERAAVRRRSYRVIIQFFHLLPDLTVQENVTLPLRILGQEPRRHRERIDGLLALLGVQHLARRLPGTLSGGEMQRVSIARALAAEPPLILADEPTGNLSSKAGEEVVALLRQVRDRLGTAILLVTHNPRDAAAGDRILFLHDGALRPEAELRGGPFATADVFHRLQELGI